MTALLYAASSGSADTVRVLLDAGADANVLDQVKEVFDECVCS